VPVTPNTRRTRLRRSPQRGRMCLSPGKRSDLRTVPLSESFGPSRSPGRLVILHRRHRHHLHPLPHQHHHGASHKYHSRMSRNKGGVSLSPLSQRSLRHKSSMHRCLDFAFSFRLFFHCRPPSHQDLLTHKSHTLSLSRSHLFSSHFSFQSYPCAMSLLAYLSLYYSPCCVCPELKSRVWYQVYRKQCEI